MTPFLPRIPIAGVSKTSDLFFTQLFPETHLSNQRFASYGRTRDKVTIGHLNQSVCKSCPRCLKVKYHVCVCGYVHADTSVSLVKQEALLTFSLSLHTHRHMPEKSNFALFPREISPAPHPGPLFRTLFC